MAKKSSTQAGKSSRSTKKKTSKKTSKKVSKKSAPARSTKKTAKKSTKKTTKKKVAKKKVAKKTTKKTAKKVSKKSTRAKKIPSKVKPVAEDFEAEKIIIKKSPLSKKELQHYRDLLVVRRAEILGDITSMSTEALRADASNLSNMPLHMADVGSDQYEQELTLGLVESERRLIQEINDALSRIADGTYGVCHKTGKRINKARLNAKPWAKYCIEAAREMERSGAYNNHRR
ncbi:TraR/DksA family transcriptional regulator [Planctomycetales bacterium ZRK34]|nr:TraR/DksA family transcriptional regulator [Planctomycetales bacterium ZRK34]